MTPEQKRAKLEAFRKEPVAIIDKPLAFLREKLTETFKDATGKWVTKQHPSYYTAAEAARKGDGATVKRMALETFYRNR